MTNKEYCRPYSGKQLSYLMNKYSKSAQSVNMVIKNPRENTLLI